MSNPLLQNNLLPPFSTLQPDQIEPAIDQLLADNRQQLETILNNLTAPSWENLVAPLEALNDRLSQAWSPVSHMNAVVNSDALRDAYNACLPKLSQYWTEMGQHQSLYEAFKALRESDVYPVLNEAQQKLSTTPCGTSPSAVSPLKIKINNATPNYSNACLS